MSYLHVEHMSMSNLDYPDRLEGRHPSIRGAGKPESDIRAISAVLEEMYGSPRLGNLDDPLDELIFIILSTRTRDDSFRATFDRLREEFPSWDDVTSNDLASVERILAPGGLSRLKALQIVSLLDRLREEFGFATLAPLSHMSDTEAERFLVRLPGVAAKVAKCVMMYSLGRQVLPVDVHVHRVASRVGLRVKARPDTSQDLIERVVPVELRYGFHVNAVAHGRTLCLPRNPQCIECRISTWCDYFHSKKGSE